MIYKLPRLRFLDSRPVKETERAEAKRVGALMVVVTVADEPVRQQCLKLLVDSLESLSFNDVTCWVILTP